MNTYTTKVLGFRDIADGTVMVELEKPKELEFKAGQFAILTLLEPKYTDQRGNNRSMSIASAPHDENLEFAWRVTGSAFKRTFSELKVGDEVQVKAPFGVFTLPEDTSVPIVFLIGGIGVTPVRAMLKEEEKNGSQRHMTLFYSNRVPTSAAYDEEFKSLNLPNFTYVSSMSDPASCPDWTGETGFICKEMVEKYIPDMKEPMYYIVGPSGFIDAMKKMLEEEGVEKDMIKIDNFGKY